MGRDADFGRMLMDLPPDILTEVLGHMGDDEVKVPKKIGNRRDPGQKGNPWVAPAIARLRTTNKTFKAAADNVINASAPGSKIASAMKTSRIFREYNRDRQRHPNNIQAYRAMKVGDMLSKKNSGLMQCIQPYDAASGTALMQRLPPLSPGRTKWHVDRRTSWTLDPDDVRDWTLTRPSLKSHKAMWRDDGPPKGSGIKVAHQRAARSRKSSRSKKKS